MHLGSQDQFAIATLDDRIGRTLAGIDAGNGTAVGDVVRDALALDRRISGRSDGARVHAELSNVQLVELACELIWTVAHAHTSFELPLGTPVKAAAIGDLRIGGEHWILDAARPGLHAMEAMRRDAHGPNLELLHRHITRLTRRLACRRIGLPSAVLIVDTDDRHLLQFPPFAPAGDVVLQRWANETDAPRFAAALPHQILALATSIVADMRALWSRRKDVTARVGKVRQVADAAAAEHGARVGLVAIDMTLQHDDEAFDLYVHYDAVDEAMRDGPVLDFFPGNRGRPLEDYSAPWGVTERRRERDELRAVGADGSIDDMAAAVAAAAPGGAGAVYAKLATDYEATITFPSAGAPTFATLYWKDGSIRAEISKRGKLDWCRGDLLEIHGETLPETILCSLAGRRLDEVAEVPFACPLVIEHAEQLDWGLRIKVEVALRLINLQSGRLFGGRSDT